MYLAPGEGVAKGHDSAMALSKSDVDIMYLLYYFFSLLRWIFDTYFHFICLFICLRG